MLIHEHGLENFTKWIQELRSGKWLQADGYLVELGREDIPRLTKKTLINECKFCCLGVAVINLMKDVKYHQVWDDDFRAVEFEGIHRKTQYLPIELVDQLGIPMDMTDYGNYNDVDLFVFVPEIDGSYLDYPNNKALVVWGSNAEHKGLKCQKIKISHLNDHVKFDFDTLADVLEFTYL